MATRFMFKDRIKRRQEEAAERQEARNKRGDAGQLDRLNKLGYTATRERAKIAYRNGHRLEMPGAVK